MTTSPPSVFAFKDKKIQKVIDLFFNKTRAKGNIKYSSFDVQIVNKVIDLIPQDIDCSSITWEFFQELFNKSIEKEMQDCTCRLISELIKNDCYSGDYIEIVETFKTVHTKNLVEALFLIFSKSLLPHNLIVFKKNTRTSCYVNDCTNLFLSFLLRDFVVHNTTAHSHEFYRNFQASLADTLITKITDFNARTFKTQYYFYKNFKERVPLLTLLKKFYLKLLSSPEGKDILHWRDGIDGNMLQTVSFNRNYEEGFLPIPLNPFDPVPAFDKWLIMPNGAENKTTKINSFSYKPINFSLCEDEILKDCVKHWFWNSKVSLTARIDQAYVIIKFINFIYDLRNKFSIKRMTQSFDEQDSISVEEIFSYVQFVKNNNKNVQYISNVKKFLDYLNENNLYYVEPSGFKYLVSKPREMRNSARDISNENLMKIEAKLKENAHDNYLNTLYYIVFHIAIATEFRISQIINLKVNCLIKGVKKDYYLESNTKVSKGKKVKIPITPYTRRYIETAIKFTQEVRDKCQDISIKEHIFIHEYSNLYFKVINVRTFSDYLKRICLELGIEPFTAQNLRDTYMTKSLEYAIKNNLSDLELKALTNHKNISTTTNHYVAEKINDYLEATHMVVIGNPTIKGNIVTETDHKHEDLVNDQCGYCPYESCIRRDDNLDCLMCSGFIATVDRIPFYEEKIRSIDSEIKSAKLPTDKERLVTIKRLYLAYLRKLLELRETTG
ncbi:integrase [Oikeobacillus pervagus]|uniref:Integrase n=1 Tax=Oikeobacillus pervagus TaxID=1325931 RepID=A0AAJ1SZ72_9BACI|nr:site-specific integrase [Oikeobacillus pervagus]MDQ0215545.1 integrase [Oikeobacillus pervagus]